MEKGLERYSEGLLDFHMHSTCSDGGDTPSELAERAKKYGVNAIALTDHHTNAGLPEFRKACKREDIFVIPFGIEISAEVPSGGLTSQDHTAPDFVILGKNAKESLVKGYQEIYFKDQRERSLPQTLDKLKEVGFDIPNVDLDEQCASFHCPPDILHSFVKYKNNIEVLIRHVKDIDSKVTREEIVAKPIRFVNKHLYAIGCPAYVPRFKGFNVKDAINLADAMNSKLFIAHPGGEYGMMSSRCLSYLIQEGVGGIEVRSYFNSHEQNQEFDRLAREYSLLRSGGSDCHGDKGPFKIGMHDRTRNQVPKEVLEELMDNLP